MTPPVNDDVVTAQDVRTAQFSLVKRGGYHAQEVDAFLDRVAEALDRRGAPATAPAAPVDVAPAAAAAAPSAPKLHDPEGAAQRLLAAAQQTSDTLTSEAESYASRLRSEADKYASTARGEADEYASATRGEADQHAASVTAMAESQAAAIRDMAADEARRLAEQARVELVESISELEAHREELLDSQDRIKTHVTGERDKVLAAIDSLRDRIAQTPLDVDPIPSDLVPSEGGSSASAAVADDVAEAFSEESPPDDRDLEVDRTDPTVDLAHPGPGPEATTKPAPPSHASPEPPQEAAVAEAESEPAEKSVFDLMDEADAGAGAVDEPALFTESPREPSIFDVEADPDWDEEADLEHGEIPTMAVPAIDDGEGVSGERFFEELERSATEGSLGPIDDDTDAALSAFFEPEEDEDDLDGKSRWRDRFGQNKS